MPSPRRTPRVPDPSAQISTTTLPAALAEGRRLTARDHQIIALLAAHRVLTAEQVARAVGFPNPTRARHRLLALHRRGILARFRHCRRPGSTPWHYTLGMAGAVIHAATVGAPLPRAGETTERVLRLHHARDLAHRVGVNEFFTRLLGHAHDHPDRWRLDEWWPEPRITEACAGIVRPDGYGKWTDTTSTPPATVGFLLEHDTGTEPLPTLLAKIDKYGELTAARITRPVLFHLPTAARETHLHQAITRRYGRRGPAALVATATHELSATSGPAARIWRPAATDHRLALTELTTPPGGTARRAGPRGRPRPAA